MQNRRTFPELSTDQLAALDTPFVGCLLKQDRSRTFQAIESMDPSGQGLDAYRAVELSEVREQIAKRALIVLIGPPGCGKSHLLSEILRHDPDVLRHNIVPLPIRHEQWFVEQEESEFGVALQGKSEDLVVIDELADDPTSTALFERAKSHSKCVLAAVGGPTSNEGKVDFMMERYADYDPFFVEMSFKPLNVDQLRGIAEAWMQRVRDKSRKPQIEASFDEIIRVSREFPVDPGMIRSLGLHTNELRKPDWVKWKLTDWVSGNPTDKNAYVASMVNAVQSDYTPGT